MPAVPDGPGDWTETMASPEVGTLPTGDTSCIGRYQIDGELGRGAMGTVYKGRDPVLGRVVAIKTITPGLLALPGAETTFLERFAREGRAAARLSHANIVAVYDSGVDSRTGAPFIVMEYVPGVTLQLLLTEQPRLPLAQALEITAQVAAALDEAHRHGIVHRDVKPANVLLDGRGLVKVADFGIARLPDSDLTQAGPGPGTPGYLAPEVLRGAPADARSDVFALGALAYVTFTGERPFRGQTQATLNLSTLQDEPVDPRLLRSEMPAAAAAVLLTALAKDPVRRPAGAGVFAAALTAALAPAAGAQVPAVEPAVARRGRRHLVLALTLAALALGVVTLAVAWVGRGERAAPEPTRAWPSMATTRPSGGADKADAGLPPRRPGAVAERGKAQGKGKKKATSSERSLDDHPVSDLRHGHRNPRRDLGSQSHADVPELPTCRRGPRRSGGVAGRR